MEYHFVTHWRVRGNAGDVYRILKDGRRYSEWWQPAYRRSDEVGPNKVRAVVRAKIPYTLDFTTELVRENPPHEFEIRAEGELEGTGLWQLKQAGKFTEIKFTWNVRANKPLVRWLSPFLKLFFEWNHDQVMKTGEQALQKRLPATRNNPTRDG